MKPTLFLAGALALALAPGAMLLPGCGGGGSGPSDLRFARAANVEFPDAPGVSGILTVSFVDQTPGANARAAGTLQLFRTPENQPVPAPFAAPEDGTSDDFIVVVPAEATYILTGDVNYSRDRDADLRLDLRGSFEGSPRFTLRGDFIENGVISLDAPFRTGNSRLRGRVTNINRVVRPGATATPIPTATAGNTTAATTAGTTAGNTTAATTAGTTAGTTTIGNTTAATTAGTTTIGNTTAATTAGTTAGATTAGTTAGATTAGTTAGATTAGNTTIGITTGATTANAGTAGSTTAGATTAGSTLGGGGTTDPPQAN